MSPAGQYRIGCKPGNIHPRPDWDLGAPKGTDRPFSDAVWPEVGYGPLEGGGRVEESRNPIENYAAGGRFEILSKLSGTEFDKAYANEIVKDHEKDAAEFQKAAISGKDPSLKEFASKTLLTLQSHLQQAREMQRTVQASREN